MGLGDLPERLDAVRLRIAAAAARVGRDAAAVRIVAVTKGHSLAVAREAAGAGLLDLGENRVQEAVAKMDAWSGAPVRWHLIGHLQRNKVKHAVGRFVLIHSLDSARLADAVEAEAAARGLVQDVLVEVNVAGEAQKTGCPPADVPALAAHASRLPHLRLRGLMTMAPFTDDAAVQRAAFAGLRQLRSRLTADGYRLDELSMGMTNDFEAAVEEGATLVRLGTALFGERAT
jgi:pyridoxal phosphate enzyme (YggS family)